MQMFGFCVGLIVIPKKSLSGRKEYVDEMQAFPESQLAFCVDNKKVKTNDPPYVG